MTTVDVYYPFATPLHERSVLALASVREVYGIRRVDLDERAGNIHIEYDATRLSEPVVKQLVRRAGIVLTEPPVDEPVPAEEIAETSAQA